jgi:hypothetical protein
MQTIRQLRHLVVLVSVLVAGCGGGGSSTSSAAVADGPPVDGSFAGTYACASNSVGSDLAFTAVLSTATGVFSSCSGSALGGVIAIACSGSIAQDGAVSLSGTDSHGNSLSFSGEATATSATGSFSIVPANVTGTFQCKIDRGT